MCNSYLIQALTLEPRAFIFVSLNVSSLGSSMFRVIRIISVCAFPASTTFNIGYRSKFTRTGQQHLQMHIGYLVSNNQKSLVEKIILGPHWFMQSNTHRSELF